MFWPFEEKKIVDAYPYLRRICDLTTPNVSQAGAIDRSENRYNRTIPALLCPWIDGRPVVERASVVVTKDMADRGLGLVVRDPEWSGDVVLGFWLDEHITSEPWFFLGNVQRVSNIGGGYWTLGIELQEYANPNYAAELQPLLTPAADLLPAQLAQI